jgi:hypothetical protein
VKTLVTAVVVLLLLVVGGDRLAARLAAGQAEKELVSRGVSDPHVVVHGFPFLTQALDKHFDHVTVTASAVSRGGLSAQDVHADIRDIQVTSSSTGTAGAVVGDGLVPWTEIAAAADLPVTLGPGPGGTVRVTGSVQILGQTLAVTADAALSVEGSEIRVRPTRVALQTGGVLDATLARPVEQALELTYPLQGLPSGVQITSLTPEHDGVRVAATAADIGVR